MHLSLGSPDREGALGPRLRTHASYCFLPNSGVVGRASSVIGRPPVTTSARGQRAGVTSKGARPSPSSFLVSHCRCWSRRFAQPTPPGHVGPPRVHPRAELK